WLLTSEGQDALASAAALHAQGVDPIRAGERLRRSLSPARAAAAMTQATLRDAARPKFGDDAARMYFTPDGLEQSTRREVATHRAARISLARPPAVLDLGCGIGGDLFALARTCLVVAGLDQDPVRAAMAGANLRPLGLPRAVMLGDA